MLRGIQQISVMQRQYIGLIFHKLPYLFTEELVSIKQTVLYYCHKSEFRIKVRKFNVIGLKAKQSKVAYQLRG
jgi:hypothetical protein